MSSGFFCVRHQTVEGPHPTDIFCLPEADMPPEIVAHIRECCPDFAFPAAPMSQPASVLLDPEPALLPAADAAGPGTGSRCAVSPAPPPPPDSEEAEPLDWLLATLRQAIEGVMADEAAKPLQKASTVARLGNLYLKTYRAAELQKENRALTRRVAGLEKALALAAAPATAAGSGSGAVPTLPRRQAAARRDAFHPTATAGAEPDRVHARFGQVAAGDWDEAEDELTATVGSTGTGRASP